MTSNDKSRLHCKVKSNTKCSPNDEVDELSIIIFVTYRVLRTVMIQIQVWCYIHTTTRRPI